MRHIRRGANHRRAGIVSADVDRGIALAICGGADSCQRRRTDWSRSKVPSGSEEINHLTDLIHACLIPMYRDSLRCI